MTLVRFSVTMRLCDTDFLRRLITSEGLFHVISLVIVELE